MLGFAFAPLVLDLTASTSDPFAYNAVVIAFQTTALGVFLRVSAPRVFAGCGRGPVAGLNLKGRWIAVTLLVGALVVSRAEYALFAWSSALIDTAVTAALFRLWPVLMVVALACYGRQIRVYGVEPTSVAVYVLSGRQVWLMAVAAVGAVVVVAGESADIGGVFSDGDLITGAGLAVTGAVCAAISPACSLILGDVFYRASRRDTTRRVVNAERMWYAVFAHTVGGVCYLPTSVFVSAGITQLDGDALVGAALVGAVCSGIGVLLLRTANTLTTDLSVNALFHAVAPLSLMLLVAVAGADIARPWLFTAGTVLVIVSTGTAEASSRRRPVAERWTGTAL